MADGGIFEKIGFFALTLVGVWVLIRIKRVIFKKVHENYEGLHLIFLERLSTGVIITGGLILAISSFGGLHTFWKTMLGGTAFASAVLIFAAQDTIKDVLAGMMISTFKPFEMGNRIELEDGTAGIIVDISMRHVVLRLIDTQMIIIPNSRLNEMKIVNYSYHEAYRSADFKFHIAYGSDVEKAIRVIRKAIMESAYTSQGKDTDHGKDYAQVYFMEYEEYSLLLETTVYYLPGTPTEVMKTDVNLRVKKALEENGIEIPFRTIRITNQNEVRTGIVRFEESIKNSANRS